MRHSLSIISLLLSLSLLSLLPLAHSAVLPTSVPSPWRSLGPANSTSPHSFILALPHRNTDQLLHRLSLLSDPTHPSYAQWLSPADVDALISPSPSSLSLVRRWLLSSGVPASHLTSYAASIEVHTTVHHTNRLFNTSLHRFSHSSHSGDPHLVAAGQVTVPDDVHAQLAMVLGVQTFPFPVQHFTAKVLPRTSRPRPSSPSSSPASPATAGARHSFHPMQSYYVYDVMVPRDLAAYYGYPDKTQFRRPAGFTANTSIAVTQFDGSSTKQSINPSDIVSQGYFAGVPSIQSNPTIYGTNVPTSPQVEPSLDIQVITANNPLHNATHWEEKYSGWIYTLCTHLRAQPVPPQVVSISWASSEQGAYGADPGAVSGGYANYLAQTEVLLAALGAQGVTVIAASGDDGANGFVNPQCSYTSQYPQSLYAMWPASSPHVVAVGATSLTSPTVSYNESGTPWCGLKSNALPAGYSYTSGFSTPFEFGCVQTGTEVAVNSNFRSGGGFSRYYPAPSWQAAAVGQYLRSGVTFPPSSYYVSSNRAIPDVSMYGQGVGVILGGQITAVGGTSLSAPLFAVLVSLLNEVSMDAGGSTLGYLNPLLYYMAANVSGTFKDITQGDNVATAYCLANPTVGGCGGCQGFQATTGWDAVTGLGSPVYSAMAAYVTQLARGQQTAAASTAAPAAAQAVSSSAAVAPVSAGGLVHWYRLAGDLSDAVNPSTTSLVLAGSSSCVSYPQVGVASAAWTQSCGVGQSPATLSVTSPSESGDVTLSAYLYMSSFSQENTWLLSCNGFVSGNVDCIDLRYDSVYGILVGRLNVNGGGQGAGATLPTQQWFHLAVTYTQSSGAFVVYVNGQSAMSFAVYHSTSSYGTPAFAGEGSDNSAFPSQASWQNFRQYSTALTQAQVQALTASDYPGSSTSGGGGGAAVSSSTSAVRTVPPTSAVQSSQQAVSSSAAVAPVSAAGLVHWYRLAGDLSDAVNPSTTSLVLAGSSSCVSYPQVGVASAAWTQSCGVGQSPATLSVTSPSESGDVTLSAYLNFPSFSQENSWLLSCNGFVSDNVDCIDLRYDSVYGVLVGRLNVNGNGLGASASLPTQQWFHLAVTYTQSTGAFVVYVNGQSVMSFTVSHSTSSYGTPAFAGEGSDNSAFPTQASWQNFRQYNTALTQAQVQALTTSDYPGSTSSGGGGGGGGAAVSSSTSAVRVVSPTSAVQSSQHAVSSSAAAGSVSTAGLVHWYRLAGDLSDAVNPSTSSLILAGSSSCVSYPQVGVASAAWTQSCGVGQSPATLSVTSPSESGDVTLSTYLYMSSFSQENTWLLSCNGFVSGNVDCIDLRYDSVYGVVVGRLNVNGNGLGVGATLPTQQWFHLAVTYTQATGAFVVYVNGQSVMSLTVYHSTSSYGTPAFAGEGSDNSAFPSQASWQNFRQYSTALTQAQVQALTTSDYPG